MADDRVVISCAVMGGADVRSMAPRLPAAPGKAHAMHGIEGADGAGF